MGELIDLLIKDLLHRFRHCELFSFFLELFDQFVLAV